MRRDTITVKLTQEEATFFLNTVTAYNALVPTDKLLELDKEAGCEMFGNITAYQFPDHFLLVACKPIVDQL